MMTMMIMRMVLVITFKVKWVIVYIFIYEFLITASNNNHSYLEQQTPCYMTSVGQRT